MEVIPNKKNANILIAHWNLGRVSVFHAKEVKAK
jgi:hypothetical protein